jgi:hypothetical protein
MMPTVASKTMTSMSSTRVTAAASGGSAERSQRLPNQAAATGVGEFLLARSSWS